MSFALQAHRDGGLSLADVGGAGLGQENLLDISRQAVRAGVLGILPGLAHLLRGGLTSQPLPGLREGALRWRFRRDGDHRQAKAQSYNADKSN